MSAHTPGPWEVAEAGSWKDGKRTSMEYFVRRPGDDVAIASDIIDPANDDAPSEVNARLIAAAPELLEALEQLLNQFDSEIHNEYDGTEMLNDRLSEANHARTAITKAKGDA